MMYGDENDECEDVKQVTSCEEGVIVKNWVGEKPMRRSMEIESQEAVLYS